MDLNDQPFKKWKMNNKMVSYDVYNEWIFSKQSQIHHMDDITLLFTTRSWIVRVAPLQA